MRTKIILSILLGFFLFFAANSQTEKSNIIVIGAHPDDADHRAGGTAIKFAQAGHKVLFVSVTNGDAGHQKMGGKELAQIRYKEAQEAGRRFGVKYVVLDNHDGQLVPSLDVRWQIIHLIRDWNADIVITHRPNDYHPDHRNTSTLVQDAAYLVIVPNIVPDTPPLKKNPVFLYMEDRFQKPQAFNADICIDITDVYDQKVYAMSAHKSQFFDWLPWTAGILDKVPTDEKERLIWLAKMRSPKISDQERENLIKWYGMEKGSKINFAESFEICEYGKQPSDKEIRQLFPMLHQ